MFALRYTFVVAVGLSLACNAVLSQDTTLLHRICNGGVFGFFDNRKGLAQNLVDKAIYNTKDADGYELYLQDKVNGNFMYSHGMCFELLTKDECLKCMESAKEQMYQECSRDGMGAQVDLTSCRLRYELYHFNNDG